MFGTIALNFFSDSSEDEDLVFVSQHWIRNGAKKRKRLRHHENVRLQRRILRDSTNVLELPEEQFIRNFKVSKLVFSKLLEEISPKMPPVFRSTHVPPQIKLARFLAFVATGISSVDQEYSSFMSKSQVSRTICEILDIFEQHLYSKWLLLEQSDEAEQLSKQCFQNISGLPGIVGCVENTQIRIKRPEKDIKDLYCNRLGYSSLNVMMICDHNKVIQYVDANSPGSLHDNHIWEQSRADNYFRTNYINGKTNTWLVGDCSYKLLPYLMTPYKKPEKVHEKFFNEKIFKARDIIRQCISDLKTRFSCLKTSKGLYYTPEKAEKTIISCCILHNICIKYKNNWRPTDDAFDYPENDDDIFIYNEELPQDSKECKESSAIRDELAMDSLLTYTRPKNPPDSNSDNNKDNHLQPTRHAAILLDYPDAKFMRTFAVNKKVFSALLDEITPHLKVTYRVTHTPAAIKLATFLEFIATGAHQTTLEHEYTSTISRSHISKVISEILEIFEEHLLKKWIRLEQSEEEELTVKQHFYNATGLPGVVGCVDNVHIQIKTPAKDVKKLYLNRNDFFSLNVMMICDHNMVIKYVDAYQPGSYHDAYVWDQSSADVYFNDNFLQGKTNTWILGDLAYKLQPYMMIPFKDPSEPHEYEFNSKHFEARKIVKNCFDILKNRFKCLTQNEGLQYTPEKASKIITACCVLHNICMTYKNYYQPCNFSLDDFDDGGEENIIESPNLAFAKSLREQVAKNLEIFK